MAWSSKTTSTQLTSITTEQFFSQTPALNPGESAHVEVDADFPCLADRQPDRCGLRDARRLV